MVGATIISTESGGLAVLDLGLGDRNPNGLP